MIEDVRIFKLEKFHNSKGMNVQIFKGDEEGFPQIRHLYCSSLYPGEIKAWHFHRRKREMIACFTGMIKLVIYDDREDSPSRGEIMEIFIGEDNFCLVDIPPGLFHGVKCYSPREAFMLVINDQPFDPGGPDKVEIPWNSHEIPYDWSIKMR